MSVRVSRRIYEIYSSLNKDRSKLTEGAFKYRGSPNIIDMFLENSSTEEQKLPSKRCLASLLRSRSETRHFLLSTGQ